MRLSTSTWLHRSIKRSIPILFTAIALVDVMGCQPHSVSLNDYKCDEGKCLPGYTCHPQTQECVPEITIGCFSLDSLCPERITTGDACSVEGAFLPCRSDAIACEAGCRTCTAEGKWSLCEFTETGIGPDAPLNLIQTCAAGSLWGNGSMFGVSCLGSGGIAGPESSNGTYSWQPGAIHVLP